MTLSQMPDRNDSLALAAATASTTTIVFLRLACQAVVLIISIRLLGADGFGTVAATIAVSLLLGPWSGIGCDFLALRGVARNPELANQYFWAGIRTIVWSSAVITGISLLLAWTLFAEWISPELLAIILAAELVFLRITELIAKVFQGADRFRDMAYTRLANSLLRLVVLGAIAISAQQLTPIEWAWAYLAAAIASALIAFYRLRAELDVSLRPDTETIGNRGDGMHFAAGVTAARMNSEFDKVLVLGLAGAASAGLYSAGYRLINLAVAPVVSFVNVTIGSLFRSHRRNQRRSLTQRSIALSLIAAVYGALVGATIWLFLDNLLPVLFGADFLPVLAGLVPITMLPLAMSVRLVTEQAMAAMALFRVRTSLQWLAVLLAVIANVSLIPVYGWTAALWVLVCAEGALALCYLAAITIVGLRNDPT